MIKIASWGNLSTAYHKPLPVNHVDTLRRHLKNFDGLGIAYGMGRSYGDVCLNPGKSLWIMQNLNRFVYFNETNGTLMCEAGVTLKDILDTFVPRGWILPVTPGTQFITIGGAIANDIHGKSHHKYGSFGNHINSITLLRTNGEIIECSPSKNRDWFCATIGGIGLTGIILKAELQLHKNLGPWLLSENIPFVSLSDFFNLSKEAEESWTHTVAWIDCLSKKNIRGIFMRANTSKLQNFRIKQKRYLTIPFTLPVSCVNKFSLKLFNSLYFNFQKRKTAPIIQHYSPYFYPLDNLYEWNKLYGPKGFFQYQSVIPMDVAYDATQAMLSEISMSGEGSFLAILKTFGIKKPMGLMSFPTHGVTLALDFPNKGEKTLTLFNKLDAIVQEAKGRLYLAKDARMSKEIFEKGYTNLSEFLKFRDPKISSSMSRRLMGY